MGLLLGFCLQTQKQVEKSNQRHPLLATFQDETKLLSPLHMKMTGQRLTYH
jgi:hypothetical protein